jgi:hypothetical protein
LTIVYSHAEAAKRIAERSRKQRASKRKPGDCRQLCRGDNHARASAVLFLDADWTKTYESHFNRSLRCDFQTSTNITRHGGVITTPAHRPRFVCFAWPLTLTALVRAIVWRRHPAALNWRRITHDISGIRRIRLTLAWSAFEALTSVRGC